MIKSQREIVQKIWRYPSVLVTDATLAESEPDWQPQYSELSTIIEKWLRSIFNVFTQTIQN